MGITKDVPSRLRDLGSLFEERNKQYKHNYRRFGGIVRQITGPVTLTTEQDFNRFALFIQIIAKVTRYGHNFNNGGHSDSLDDCSVYAQMLREVDDRADQAGMYAVLSGIDGVKE